jgi:hypothetical protein
VREKESEKERERERERLCFDKGLWHQKMTKSSDLQLSCPRPRAHPPIEMELTNAAVLRSNRDHQKSDFQNVEK